MGERGAIFFKQGSYFVVWVCGQVYKFFQPSIDKFQNSQVCLSLHHGQQLLTIWVMSSSELIWSMYVMCHQIRHSIWTTPHLTSHMWYTMSQVSACLLALVIHITLVSKKNCSLLAQILLKWAAPVIGVCRYGEEIQASTLKIINLLAELKTVKLSFTTSLNFGM